MELLIFIIIIIASINMYYNKTISVWYYKYFTYDEIKGYLSPRDYYTHMTHKWYYYEKDEGVLNMFEPFRCEECLHGEFYPRDGVYYYKYEYDFKDDEEQCEQNYEDADGI